MSGSATLARPYAEAVFKRAKETGSTEQWSDTLAFLAAVMNDDRLSRAAVNPKVDRHAFTELLLDICKGHITDEGENLLKLLVENNRLNQAASIQELFEQYRAEDEGYIDVDVKTAFPIDDRQQRQLTSALEKTFHKQVRLRTERDDTLIGGVLIRAGDTVIDGSIRGQLQQLAKRLYD
jgi:F-type H+-transporting ATPase subunit delta